MTFAKAVKWAKRHSEDGKVRYVVRDDGRDEPRGRDYHVTNDEGLDTFYHGCPVVFCTEEYGEYDE